MLFAYSDSPSWRSLKYDEKRENAFLGGRNDYEKHERLNSISPEFNLKIIWLIEIRKELLLTASPILISCSVFYALRNNISGRHTSTYCMVSLVFGINCLTVLCNKSYFIQIQFRQFLWTFNKYWQRNSNLHLRCLLTPECMQNIYATIQREIMVIMSEINIGICKQVQIL